MIWLFRQAMEVARADRREKIEAEDLINGFIQGLKAGAPWLAERKNKPVGISFPKPGQPYLYLVRL